MKRFLCAVLLCVLTGPALADTAGARPGDILLSPDDLQRLTAGNTLTFFDQGQSRFSVGGAYSYTYPDSGGTAFGVFDIRDDGTVCIQFRNGRSRCDLYVRRGAVFYLITQSGDRFPFQTEFRLQP